MTEKLFLPEKVVAPLPLLRLIILNNIVQHVNVTPSATI